MPPVGRSGIQRKRYVVVRNDIEGLNVVTAQSAQRKERLKILLYIIGRLSAEQERAIDLGIAKER